MLAEMFRDAGLERRLLNLRQLPVDAGLRFPCDRSVGFHIVLEGALFIHGERLDAPLELGPGDIALMGRGSRHVLAPRARLGRLPLREITIGDEHEELRSARRTGAATVVSGAYQLWHRPLHPFFGELPAWHVRRAVESPGLDPLALSVGLLADEVRREASDRDTLGRSLAVHGLLDLLFTYLLRDVVEKRGLRSTGWSHAIRDPQVRAAVALVHHDCARDWTLDSLAKAAGLSRSVLAARFREAMGDTPLAYVRTVRLQRAMRLLAESDGTLEQVAAQVGYQDAFGFSKAFKRAVGMSPGQFRRRDASERGFPGRLAAS